MVAKDFRIRHLGSEVRREFAPQAGDVVASEHWGSSGFANTDLDGSPKRGSSNQLLRKIIQAATDAAPFKNASRSA